MHELISFPLAVGDLGTRLALTIIFFGVILRLKIAGDSRGYLALNSLLCIYLKRMHEVQRLISTGLRDIHNWIKMRG